MHILRLASFQSCVSDFLYPVVSILTVYPAHFIVHTDPDGVCGDGPQSSDTVRDIGTIDVLLIMLFICRNIIRVTMFNIVVII